MNAPMRMATTISVHGAAEAGLETRGGVLWLTIRGADRSIISRVDLHLPIECREEAGTVQRALDDLLAHAAAIRARKLQAALTQPAEELAAEVAA